MLGLDRSAAGRGAGMGRWWGAAGVVAMIVLGCRQADLSVRAGSVSQIASQAMLDRSPDPGWSAQELEAEILAARHLQGLHRAVLDDLRREARSDDGRHGMGATLDEHEGQLALAQQRIETAQRAFDRLPAGAR